MWRVSFRENDSGTLFWVSGRFIVGVEMIVDRFFGLFKRESDMVICIYDCCLMGIPEDKWQGIYARYYWPCELRDTVCSAEV